MKKIWIKGTGIFAMVALLMCGCGAPKVPDKVDVTSISITEDGGVTSYLVDEFDKDYYNISDLTAMAIGEVADYNTKNQTGEDIPIVVEKVEGMQDGSNKVRVIHKYNKTDTYMDYNGSVLFYGTVKEALDAGYLSERGGSSSLVLKDVKDDTLMVKEQLLQDQDRYLVITNEAARVYCPAKVTHVSEGATYMDDGSVDCPGTEELSVMLLK